MKVFLVTLILSALPIKTSYGVYQPEQNVPSARAAMAIVDAKGALRNVTQAGLVKGSANGVDTFTVILVEASGRSISVPMTVQNVTGTRCGEIVYEARYVDPEQHMVGSPTFVMTVKEQGEFTGRCGVRTAARANSPVQWDATITLARSSTVQSQLRLKGTVEPVFTIQ